MPPSTRPKAAGSGSPPASRGGRARIAVSDEGPGIPARARTRVFDMFYRVDEGDGQRAGTGLGLAICKGIVDAHGGEISAVPGRADGTGTRIEVVLPLAGPEGRSK